MAAPNSDPVFWDPSLPPPTPSSSLLSPPSSGPSPPLPSPRHRDSSPISDPGTSPFPFPFSPSHTTPKIATFFTDPLQETEQRVETMVEALTSIIEGSPSPSFQRKALSLIQTIGNALDTQLHTGPAPEDILYAALLHTVQSAPTTKPTKAAGKKRKRAKGA